MLGRFESQNAREMTADLLSVSAWFCCFLGLAERVIFPLKRVKVRRIGTSRIGLSWLAF